MFRMLRVVALTVICGAFAGCLGEYSPLGGGRAPAPDLPVQQVMDLNHRYERLREFVGDGMYGPEAAGVLQGAHEGLREKWGAGEAAAVCIEGLWACAVAGRTVEFGQDPWGATQTADGAWVVGPWRLDAELAGEHGSAYGVEAEWTGKQVRAFLRQNPRSQAMIAADCLAKSRAVHGWQGPHAACCGGSEAADEARRFLIGTPDEPTGLLFWLVVTGEEGFVRETLAECSNADWRPELADVPAAGNHPEVRARLRELIAEVYGPQSP